MSLEHSPARSRKKATHAGATRPMQPSILKIIEDFDRLPEDMIIPEAATRVLINSSEWTQRRHPTFRRIQISPGRFGNRVGDIRALARGERPP